MTELYVKLLEFLPQPGQADAMSVPERQAWLEAMVLITEIYLSLVSQDLPEYFEVIVLCCLIKVAEFRTNSRRG